MSRNRYIRFVHKLEGQQIMRREKELADLARRLQRGINAAVELPVANAKVHRSSRLEQKIQHKSEHVDSAADARHRQDRSKPRSVEAERFSSPATRETFITRKGA
jgi:hypothetical protein